MGLGWFCCRGMGYETSMNGLQEQSGLAFRGRAWLAGLALVVLVFLAFGGALRCGFVRFDDDVYVFENPAVGRGLTWEGVRWAFTTGHAANWHPLTWLSHMADVELFGLDPMGHHAMSLWIHALNAMLLFFVLGRMTGRSGLSFFAAALWAVHPLRTESVVWVSERKDVLAMFFGLLAMGAYGQQGARGRGAWTALFFALSLMSKPTWVTLPFLLLLVDYWPLRRWPAESTRRLVLEKWPLFALAAVSCVVTYLVQHRGGAVQAFERYPLDTRLANAAVAVVVYLRDLIWPYGLSFFYPHPGAGIPGWQMGSSAALLILLTGAVLWAVRRQPWWFVGWLWFLGTLVPMIGLVQVGAQARADRYTYLPHIGLLAALVWGAAEIAEQICCRPGGGPTGRLKSRSGTRPTRGVQTGLVLVACALVLGLTLLSRRQTMIWRDSETLFRHALAVQEANAVAHGNLGSWLATQGRGDEARLHLGRSLALQPRFNEAHINLGNLDLQEGRREEALAQYRQMIGDFPRHVQALNNVAWLLASAPVVDPAQMQEALAYAQRAVAATRNPGASVLDTLALAWAATGDFEAAIEAGEEAKSRAQKEGRADLARAIETRLAGWRLNTPQNTREKRFNFPGSAGDETP